MKYYVYLALFLLCCSCHKEIQQTVNVQIRNDLDNSVRIEFYRNGFVSGSGSEQVNGKGILYEGSDTDRLVTLATVFVADSIALIFDNQRFEHHLALDNVPLNGNLFSGASYIDNEDVLIYTINENNLNNSVSCDGACY